MKVMITKKNKLQLLRQKLEVQSKRRSKRLKDIAQKQAKKVRSDSHSSQNVNKNNSEGVGSRQRKQTSKAKPSSKRKERKAGYYY